MPRPFDYPYEARSLRHDGKWGNKARLWTLPRARKPSSPSRSAGPFYTYLTAVSHTLVVRLWLHKTVCVAVAPPVSCTACFASQGKRERHDGTALVSALHNDHRVRWLGDLIQRSAIPGDLESETSPPTRRRPIPPASMSQTLFSDTPLHNATPRRLPTKNPTAAPRFRGFAGARHGWRANMPATGSCSAPLFALPDVVSGARAGFSQPRTPQAAAVGSPQEEEKKKHERRRLQDQSNRAIRKAPPAPPAQPSEDPSALLLSRFAHYCTALHATSCDVSMAFDCAAPFLAPFSIS